MKDQCDIYDVWEEPKEKVVARGTPEKHKPTKVEPVRPKLKEEEDTPLEYREISEDGHFK